MVPTSNGFSSTLARPVISVQVFMVSNQHLTCLYWSLSHTYGGFFLWPAFNHWRHVPSEGDEKQILLNGHKLQ